MTSVEFLEDAIFEDSKHISFDLYHAIEQSKEMEEEQKDDFAIGFAEWLNKYEGMGSYKQLLEIYKTEKGL